MIKFIKTTNVFHIKKAFRTSVHHKVYKRGVSLMVTFTKITHIIEVNTKFRGPPTPKLVQSS